MTVNGKQSLGVETVRGQQMRRLSQRLGAGILLGMSLSLSACAANGPTAIGARNEVPVPMAEPGADTGATTGTQVGEKVSGLRGELNGLKSKVSSSTERLQSTLLSTERAAARYHALVGAISAKLQVGTTPGNPNLTRQWAEAQNELEQISGDVAALNDLSNETAANASRASFLLDSAKATYQLSGAVDEDHAQLRAVEDETNRTVVTIDRLLAQLSEDTARQTAFVGIERQNLTVLSNGIAAGELFGPSLANVAARQASAPAYAPKELPSGQIAMNRRPLVVIRFDRPDPSYRQALYSAINKAVERRPESGFDVVGISPASGTPGDVALAQSQARSSTDQVVRSMRDMGLPAGRVQISSTTSTDVASPEVHVFVR